MTIYSMAFFSYSWCVWCLRTFHQLCHQVVFPKWRTGALRVPAVIYLSFWKHDCSIYPCRGHTPKGILQYLPPMLTWLCCSLPAGAQNKGSFPCTSPVPRWGTADNSRTSETPGGFPRHNSHWAHLCLHVCKNNYGLTPLRPQYTPLKYACRLDLRIVPRNT